MNPLSIWTFYRRHKKRALLLLCLVGLVTAGLYIAAAMTWAIFTEPMRTNYMFLSEINLVMPSGDTQELDPGVGAMIRSQPGVAEVLPAVASLGIGVPEPMGGQVNWMTLLALQEEDVPGILDRFGATVSEGRMLQPRASEIMLSRKVANALDVQVGDLIHSGVDVRRYRSIREPMEVVAILETDVRLGIISYEYLANHEAYRGWVVSGFVVTPERGREREVDSFLLNEVQNPRVNVSTFQEVSQVIAQDYQKTIVLAIPLAVVLALAVTLVIGAINRMALMQRLPEFGILHATGLNKRWLSRRLAMETTILAVIGWVMGILLSHVGLYLIDRALFEPRGHDLNVTLAPAATVALIPVVVILFTVLSARRVFARLDAIAIVEQGELESHDDQKRGETVSRSNPLSSLTFFGRHKKRVALLGGAMSLVIVAVAMLIFVFAAVLDAQGESLGDLAHMSTIGGLVGRGLDPGIVTQVRTHPTVERAMPFVRYGLLQIAIPPFAQASVAPFGMYEEDLRYVAELYGLELVEGALPRPRTNEIVIPDVVAQNRGLGVGDVIGDPDHPAYRGEPSLPTQFVISGVFARPPAGAENWLSFISLEFVESHEAFDLPDGIVLPLVVVARDGERGAMDDWLESEIAGSEAMVTTYRSALAEHRQQMRNLLSTMGIIEIVITLVTAGALAALNYLSTVQRQAEFGVLNALGRNQRYLVWRTVGETATITGLAWVVSLVVCVGGMLVFQAAVFTPLGLRLDITNPVPWLATLPTPALVLAVTFGTVSRILSGLDPVAVIERR